MWVPQQVRNTDYNVQIDSTILLMKCVAKYTKDTTNRNLRFSLKDQKRQRQKRAEDFTFQNSLEKLGISSSFWSEAGKTAVPRDRPETRNKTVPGTDLD